MTLRPLNVRKNKNQLNTWEMSYIFYNFIL